MLSPRLLSPRRKNTKGPKADARYLFLFNDLLICCKKKHELLKNNSSTNTNKTGSIHIGAKQLDVTWIFPFNSETVVAIKGMNFNSN